MWGGEDKTLPFPAQGEDPAELVSVGAGLATMTKRSVEQPVGRQDNARAINVCFQVSRSPLFSVKIDSRSLQAGSVATTGSGFRGVAQWMQQ